MRLKFNMKIIAIILLLPSLVFATGCGGQKPEPAKQLKKQAVEIQDFLQKSQSEKDTERRQHDVFMQLGKKMTYEEFQLYVSRISDDDQTND